MCHAGPSQKFITLAGSKKKGLIVGSVTDPLVSFFVHAESACQIRHQMLQLYSMIYGDVQYFMNN